MAAKTVIDGDVMLKIRSGNLPRPAVGHLKVDYHAGSQRAAVVFSDSGSPKLSFHNVPVELGVARSEKAVRDPDSQMDFRCEIRVVEPIGTSMGKLSWSLAGRGRGDETVADVDQAEGGTPVPL